MIIYRVIRRGLSDKETEMKKSKGKNHVALREKSCEPMEQ